jgi:phosphatidylglycerol---prolipoprotein diacylglyceryl transferase
VLVEIGPVKTFGLLFGLGFLLAGAVLARRLRETGRSPDWAYEIVGAGLAGGIVGARLAWLLEDPERFGDAGAVFGGTGLVWYGGAIGGALGVVAWAWWRGALGAWLFDACAVPLALGYAVGRIGCQVSGDGDYGREWDGPWAMAYPDGTVPIDVPVHPTPLYEAVAMGLVAWGLWRLRDRVKPWGLFGLYLVASAAERFLVEFLRRNDPVAAGLTFPQWQSVALLLAGAVLLWRLGGPFERQRANSLKPAT